MEEGPQVVAKLIVMESPQNDNISKYIAVSLSQPFRKRIIPPLEHETGHLPTSACQPVQLQGQGLFPKIVNEAKHCTHPFASMGSRTGSRHIPSGDVPGGRNGPVVGISRSLDLCFSYSRFLLSCWAARFAYRISLIAMWGCSCCLFQGPRMTVLELYPRCWRRHLYRFISHCYI